MTDDNTKATDSRIYFGEPAGEGAVNMADCSLEVSDEIEEKELRTPGPAVNQEFSISFEFDIETDQTRCNVCGEMNTIPDSKWLFLFGTDVDCGKCGCALEIVR